MILTRELVSFLEGVKPALLISGDTYSVPTLNTRNNLKPKKMPPSTQYLLDKGYPFVKNILRGVYLFFQTEEMRQDFLGNATVTSIYKGIEYPDYDIDKIGIILGYPPIAVDYVVSTSNDPRNNPRTGVSYYGISFVCKPSDVEACIKWCENTYTLTDKMLRWKGGLRVDGLPYALWLQKNSKQT